MKLNELFENFGKHGSRGPAQGLFTTGYLVDLAKLCYKVPSAVKADVIDWFCDILTIDNPRFKEALFRKAAAEGTKQAASPRWQQRHYYYLADMIRKIDDTNMRKYIAVMLADYFVNYRDPSSGDKKFKKEIWYDACGVHDPDTKLISK